MSRVLELRQRKTDLKNEGKALLDKAEKESRDLSDEEAERFDAIVTEKETVEKSLEREEWLLAQDREEGRSAFETEETATAEVGAASFATLGEQLQAVANCDLGHGQDPRLIRAAATGSGETVPSDGGFLVQTDFATELLRDIWETGLLAQRVRRIPISANSNSLKMNAIDESSRATGSRWGGVQVFWVGEGDPATASRPKLRQIELSLQKLMGLHYVTDELLADSTALEAVSRLAFSEEFVFMYEDAIVNGSGGGQPLGYMNGGSLVTIAKETGQLANSLVVENIVKIWARMLPRSRRNAVWLINQSIEPQLYTLGITFGTGGQAIYMPAGSIAGQPFSTLMGRPILESEYAGALGAKGDIQLVDLAQYITIDKGPMQQAASLHVRFLNDEMTFRYVWRVNGMPAHDKAITPFKGSDTLSPFVTLAART